jgi:hypothetical protein
MQTYAHWWVNKFKLNIPKFQGWLQPEEFLVIEKLQKFDKKKVERRRRLGVNWLRRREMDLLRKTAQ